MKISIIAAMDENRVIGNGGKLPAWTAPGDLKRFKELTTGKVVIMGRKTFESIGKPLPNRTNVVITSRSEIPGLLVAPTLEAALDVARSENKGNQEVMVIGGAQVYETAMEMADTIYLTLVKGQHQGDVFFPVIPEKNWDLLEFEHLPTHSYLTYKRV